jgi:hypothetical protein
LGVFLGILEDSELPIPGYDQRLGVVQAMIERFVPQELGVEVARIVSVWCSLSL